MNEAIAQNNLSYRGFVTLQKMQGAAKVGKPKTIHNTGVLQLFALIANCLTDNLKDGNDNPPKYLGIGISSGATDFNATKLLNEVISIGSRFDITVQKGYKELEKTVWCAYSCNIPYTSISNTTIFELGLYSASDPTDNTMVARVFTNDGIQLENGQSLLVNWRIQLGNGTIEN